MAGGIVGVWGWEGMGGSHYQKKGIWGVGWRGRGARGRGQEMMAGSAWGTLSLDRRSTLPVLGALP